MQLKRLIFSHYFYSGLTVAFGLFAVASASFVLFGQDIAVSVSTGALCVSFADVPSVPRNKRIQLLAALVLAFLVTLAVGLSQPVPWRVGATILAVTFGASMLTAYGRDAMPVSFSAFFSMVLALGTPMPVSEQALRHSLLVGAGGTVYLIYALALAAWLKLRTKQQALSECLYHLAQYLTIKSRCYDAGVDLDVAYQALVRQHSLLNGHLQTARDFVFRDVNGEPDTRLASVLIATLDAYEHILSSQTDYVFLHQHYADSDVLIFLRDLALKGAADFEQMSYDILRNRVTRRRGSYKAELFAIHHELDRMSGRVLGDQVATHALAILKTVCSKASYVVEKIGALHVAALAPARQGDLLGGADLALFVTRPTYSPRVLLQQLRKDSPVFRFAVRTTLAMGVAYMVATNLPYAAHGQWILLTVAVIMRLNFSQTKHRRTDRVAGNVAGCLLTAVVLHFFQAAGILLVFILVATAVAHTFVTIRYRYTAAAGCVAGLLQLHLLDPGGAFLVGERVLDTFVGALVAYAFSFVLPVWEYRNLPRLAAALLLAGEDYTRVTLRMAAHDVEGRLARKRFHDAVSTLASAVGRMLDEPRNRHRSAAELNGLLARSYLLASHLAAVSVWRTRRANQADPYRTACLMASASERVRRVLAEAAGALSYIGRTAIRRADQDDASESEGSWDTRDETELSSEALLERRLEAIQADATKMGELSTSIAAAW